MQIAAREIATSKRGEQPSGEWWGFYVEALEAGVNVSMQVLDNYDPAPDVSLEASKDGGKTWVPFYSYEDWSIVIQEEIILSNIGDRVCIRAGNVGNDTFADGGLDYHYLHCSKRVAVGGEIRSLLKREVTNIPSTLSSCAFQSFFSGETSLVDSTNLILPNSIGESCYAYMFSGCTSLTTAPALPATTLANNCYNSMFQSCTSLTSAPTLLATTLVDYCYSGMFQYCTKLSLPPDLPATTLARNCYSYMFYGCSSLTYAPILYATTLVPYCYSQMFFNCNRLASIVTSHTAWNSNNATYNWVSSVKSSGTFTCPAALPQTRGISYIPNNWTIVTT